MNDCVEFSYAFIAGPQQNINVLASHINHSGLVQPVATAGTVPLPCRLVSILAMSVLSSSVQNSKLRTNSVQNKLMHMRITHSFY